MYSKVINEDGTYSLVHSDIIEDDYLAHHGVLGQKWGVRRFQNADGSLTPKGKKHLASLESKSNKLYEKSKKQSSAQTKAKISDYERKAAEANSKRAYYKNEEERRRAKRDRALTDIGYTGNLNKAERARKRANRYDRKATKYAAKAASMKNKATKTAAKKEKVDNKIAALQGQKYLEQLSKKQKGW
ncbi:MAG TPA: hypothetical protein DCW90_06865 [Lachnospiraceae bacterium]|nr:hypothetical protein [Lachnospiraceae bacterium]